MKKNLLIYVGLGLIVYIGAKYLISNAGNINLEKLGSTAGQNTRYNCVADDCLAVDNLDYPVEELPDEVKGALTEAINDEYKALSTYKMIIARFGAVRPFSMIVGAEEQHIASLKALFDKYGITVPENTWLNKMDIPDSLQKACQTGVDAEIANAALYKDKLIPLVTNYEDITLIFKNLMDASEQKHLPAFENCN